MSVASTRNCKGCCEARKRWVLSRSLPPRSNSVPAKPQVLARQLGPLREDRKEMVLVGSKMGGRLNHIELARLISPREHGKGSQQPRTAAKWLDLTEVQVISYNGRTTLLGYSCKILG